ncbi:MAG: hypothetical protein G01um101431_315 [Parcubacteria group bacterium Gr01-1014_31]|nr:MAG: hypothetical protein G01um101431_315 [Parcubacteria group bacterium Gr01-1014_31]
MHADGERQHEKQKIINTLQIATDIFRLCNAEYRIVGSTLIAAHVGRVFRHIGDLDVVLDEENKECVFEHLRKAGFTLENKMKMGFRWTEAAKDEYLGLTFLLVGKFTKDYFSRRFMKVGEIRITSDYLRRTPYHFENLEFVGIPLSSVLAGIYQSFLNPKRKIDKNVLEKEYKMVKPKIFGNIEIYIFGVKVPFLYDLFSFFYNVYGGIRIVFGKKYEIWS